MSLGELCTRWTVRLALLGYFAGAIEGDSPLGRRMARLAWTLGCLCYLTHVACAFHFYHGWSHADAYRHTAERTAAATGWQSGAGLYLNYAFTALWLADVLCWWRPTARRLWPALVQPFLFFMVFNATVVFGHGLVRWFGLVGCLLVFARWLPTFKDTTAPPNKTDRPT